MKKEEFILYQWNNETKEFWFLGEKIDYVHNPSEWKKYLNDLVTKNKELQEVIDKAIEYIKEKSKNNCWISQYENCDLIKILKEVK